MTDLSPAAQAVLDAALQYEINPECYSREIAAVALEAAADQVVPKEWPTIEDYNEYEQGVAAAHIKCRNQILAIAAELRGNTAQEDTMTEKQIPIEEALKLVEFKLIEGIWLVKHVHGNVWGDVKGRVYGDVQINVHGTINGREWQHVDPKERLKRLIGEGAGKAQLLEAVNQLEDN